MTKQPSKNARSFCEKLISSLFGSFQVCESYFVAGNSAKREDAFDYKIIVVAPFCPEGYRSLYPIIGWLELSFLECLLLREVIRHIDSSHWFVLGARFGPGVNRGADGRALSPLEILASQDRDFMSHLLGSLAVCSPYYLLFDDIPFEDPPQTFPGFLNYLMLPLHNEEMLGDNSVDDLNASLHWVVHDVGLVKLLTIPELDRKQQSKQLPLTRQDASRIRLIQDVVQPQYNNKPAKELGFVGAHWAKITARLFVFGPILDVVNALRERLIVKVCWNCGKLYRPDRYKKKDQKFCSRACRRRAQSKRDYRKEKEENGEKAIGQR